MSVEQWGILALIVLPPLLQGVARLRRMHAGPGEAPGRIGPLRPSQRGATLPDPDADDAVGRGAKQAISPPSPLPHPATPPAGHRSGPARRASSLRGSTSFEPHRGSGRPVAAGEVAQWLRPVRNLRRAVVIATILGPPAR